MTGVDDKTQLQFWEDVTKCVYKEKIPCANFLQIENDYNSCMMKGENFTEARIRIQSESVSNFRMR